MKIPRLAYQTVEALTLRWGICAETVISWAMDGHFDIAVALPAVRCQERTVSGLLGVEPVDVHPLFRRQDPEKRVRIRRVRDRARHWLPITFPADGAVVRRGAVALTMSEVERFEIAHGLVPGAVRDLVEQAREAGQRATGGAPQRYDWDGFYAAVARRLHNDGLPRTQAELVREMEDWFAARGAGAVPDASLIRRKVRGVLQAVQAPDAG